MRLRPTHFARLTCLAVLLIGGLGSTAQGAAPGGAEHVADDPVARLQHRLDARQADLKRDDRHGFLDAVLRELKLPVSSQTLVFSKTSLQRDHISPAAPRAIYFNDDTYLGYVRGGGVLEIATTDPKRGTVFYTLDQQSPGRPRFERQTDSCLQCHGSSMTRYQPGLLLRSVVPDPTGQPILSAGTSLVTQETPLEKRWGGWYVTGTHGDQRHMGNRTVAADAPDPLAAFSPGNADGRQRQNLTDLSDYCDVTGYPSRHSDVVALMVLEHQAEMHNLMGRAATAVEQALRDERTINAATGRSSDAPHSDSTLSRIKSAGEPLLKYMLFCNEAKLTAPLKGTTDFAAEFAGRGPRDKQGRSLRDLDLRTRMFRFPCSYLIYSEQWDGLPSPLLDYLYRRLWLISHEKEKGGDYDHLTTDDRDAIREILLETKSGLPEYWKRTK